MSNHQRKKFGFFQIDILKLIKTQWNRQKNMFFETYVQLFQFSPSNVLAPFLNYEAKPTVSPFHPG